MLEALSFVHRTSGTSVYVPAQDLSPILTARRPDLQHVENARLCEFTITVFRAAAAFLANCCQT